MRSYKAQISLLTIALVFAAMPAAAQSQEDEYNKAVKDLSTGAVPAAWTAFCGPLKGYKDSDAQCAAAKEAMKPYESRHNKLYTDGMEAMQNKDYDKAESLFKQVRYGNFIQQAKDKLAEATQLKLQKQQQDAAAQQNASAAAASETKFNEGVSKFAQGDLNGAKAAFEAVTGGRQGEAAGYISRINTYNTKMAEAKNHENSKNWAAAQAAYTAASLISANGPGDPLGSVQRVLSSSSGGSAPTPTNNQQTQTASNVQASRDVVKTVDVASYVAQGKRFLARGDYARARRFFGDVLAQDPRNEEAQAGLKEANEKDTSKPTATAEDTILAAAVRTFYEGDFKAAEFRLDDYIYNNRGKKQGLANFYRGVLYLQQYYLGGERDSQAYQDAIKRFQTAKGTEGFVPPEKYVSPRIMKVFKEAPGS